MSSILLFRRYLSTTVLCLLLLSQHSSSSSTKRGQQISAIIQWVHDKGGTFNSKLEIRPSNPNDPTSHWGMFARAALKPKEVLLEIPRDLLISPQYLPNETYLYEDCQTVHHLMREMRLGNASFHGPYVNYLLDKNEGQSALPSMWSVNGKALLRLLLSDERGEQVLPPEHITDRVPYDWIEECDGNDDPLELQTYSLLVQRGWDYFLVPLYDMMSHRNGRWYNTEDNKVVSDEMVIRVRASRLINAGEELYMSYNFCADCENRADDYGTFEILRDYGFVESYPQRYIFHQFDGVGFDIDMDTMDLTNDKKPLKVQWIDDDINDHVVSHIDHHLVRLESFDLDKYKPNIPPQEYTVIEQLYKALIIAFKNALFSAVDVDDKDDDNNKSIVHYHACLLSAELSCPANLLKTGKANYYDALEEEEDDLAYHDAICDEENTLSFSDYNRSFEVVKTPYQDLQFFYREKDRDVCFELNEIVQMCGSYRPHYHEMVVHFTARFIPDMKRVLWVGGGDSMLLHEILKYDQLELVVGLELDQKVTRHSFKHFGTQPHWDNPKVQWWYGDATKSLLMLPKHYFGSFDAVLVDLSETVMSFLVTDGMDVMQALATLLTPEGIFVKNELYLDKLSPIFENTIQIHYYDVPVICSQCLILGSHKTDFLMTELHNHHIDHKNLFINPLNHTGNVYDIVHDYRRKPDDNTCRATHFHNKTEHTQTKTQTQSPGIMMILEAEDVTLDLINIDQLKHKLTTHLSTNSLLTLSSTIASPSDKSSNTNIITIIAQEGYITVRSWPLLKYCAFDIHLWSVFDKHNDVKEAVLKAVGATRVSSYRIVAGGMFGVSSWEQDESSRGPKRVDQCGIGDRIDSEVQSQTEKDKSETEPSFQSRLADTIIDEGVKGLISEQNMTVAVICGPQTQTCQGIDALATNPNIHHIMKLYACPNILNFTPDSSDEATKAMKDCEEQLYSQIVTHTNDYSPIRVIVIDPSAPISMGQIIHKILSQTKNLVELVAEEIMILATTLTNNPHDLWKRHLLERFRKIVKYEPLFRAEVDLNLDNDIQMTLEVTSSGDTHFINNLKSVLNNIQDKIHQSGSMVVSDIRQVHGGLWKYQPKFKPSQFFLPGDYDQREPLKQYMSQVPLAHHSLFQLELQKDNKETGGHLHPNGIIPLTVDIVKKGLLDTEKILKEYLNTHQEGNDAESPFILQRSELSIGKGVIHATIFPHGNVVLLWDGNVHIDINVFTFEEDLGLHTLFRNHLRNAINSQLIEMKNEMWKLVKVLHDEQPRGYGRVVNFQRDFGDGERQRPHWAVGELF